MIDVEATEAGIEEARHDRYHEDLARGLGGSQPRIRIIDPERDYIREARAGLRGQAR